MVYRFGWVAGLASIAFALWRLALGVVDYEAPEWAVAAKEMETW